MSLNEEEVTRHWKGWSTRKEEKEEGKPIEGGESTGRYWSQQRRQRDMSAVCTCGSGEFLDVNQKSSEERSPMCLGNHLSAMCDCKWELSEVSSRTRERKAWKLASTLVGEAGDQR